MSEIHGAVGSYVANALDPDERREFEKHLAVCPTCSREVAEFSETAAELSSLVQAPPPPMLRSAVLSSIQQVRPLPPLPEEGPEAEPRRAASMARTEPDGSSAPVDELALRRQRRTARVLSLAVAAAMVIALAMGGWVVNLVQQRQTQAAEAALETQLLSAPDAKVYASTMPDGTPVSFVVSKSMSKAMFVGADMPDPGGDQLYKLWMVPPGTGAQPVGDNTFSGGGSRKVWMQSGIADAAGLAVSVEKDANTPQPTSTPVVVPI